MTALWAGLVAAFFFGSLIMMDRQQQRFRETVARILDRQAAEGAHLKEAHAEAISAGLEWARVMTAHLKETQTVGGQSVLLADHAQTIQREKQASDEMIRLGLLAERRAEALAHEALTEYEAREGTLSS